MGSGGEFVFRANGEFERGKGDSKRGQYELEGFTLVLHALDGSETRYAIYTWPWAGGAIGIERKMYQVIAIKKPTG